MSESADCNEENPQNATSGTRPLEQFLVDVWREACEEAEAERDEALRHLDLVRKQRNQKSKWADKFKAERDELQETLRIEKWARGNAEQQAQQFAEEAESLKAERDFHARSGEVGPKHWGMLEVAEAERDALRAALEDIRDYHKRRPRGTLSGWMQDVAREALEASDD